jgi:hypothetical protein
MSYGWGLGWGGIELWGSVGIPAAQISRELGEFNFSCKALFQGNSIEFSFTVPEVADAPQWTRRLRVLRKQGEWPQSWDDSDAYESLDDVFPLSGTYTITETGLEAGVIYYYVLFAEGTDGVWVSDPILNRCSKYPYNRWGFVDYTYNSLPRGYRSEDATLLHLYQFLSVFGAMLDSIKTDTENLLSLFSIDEIHDDLIYLIDKKLGWPTWHVAGGLQRRIETTQAVDLYKLLGRAAGYEQLLEGVSEWDATIVEGWKYVMFSNGLFGSTTPDMTDPDVIRLRGRIEDVLKYTPDTDGWHSVTGLGFFLQEIPGVSEEISEAMLDRTVFLIDWSKASYVTYGLIAQPTIDELVRVAEESFYDDLFIHYESQGVTDEEDLGYTTSSWTLFESMHDDIPDAYARWPMNESSGTNVPDVTGNGRNGTTVNMEDGDWGPGKLGNCLTFDGVNESVNCGDNGNFEYNESWSVEFWFNTTVTVTDMVISRRETSGDARGWDVRHQNGYIVINLRHDSSNYLYVRFDVSGLNDGSWHHVIITYSGSSLASGIIGYIDNVAESNIVISDTLGSNTILNSANLYIASLNGAGNWYGGKLDEVAIYERVLTSSEVAYRWNSGAGRPYPATLAYNTEVNVLTDRTFHSSIVYV